MTETEDDLRWSETLAGRGDAPDGRALREAVSRLRAEEAQERIGADVTREDALIERARKEGLVPPEKPRAMKPEPARRSGFSWSFGLRAAAAVAAVLVVAIGLERGLKHETEPVPETVRGSVAGIQRLEVDDPIAVQHEILEALRAAGIGATGYERLGRQGIDAELPPSLPAPVAELLQRHHLAVPPDGVLQVEIVKRGE